MKTSRWRSAYAHWRRPAMVRKLAADFARRRTPARLPSVEVLPVRTISDLEGGLPCDLARDSAGWACVGTGDHIYNLLWPSVGAYQRYCDDVDEIAASVACGGSELFLIGLTYPKCTLIACADHEDWLRRHDLLNGLDSGVIARRPRVITVDR